MILNAESKAFYIHIIMQENPISKVQENTKHMMRIH
jgi:hypothetical protein